MNRLLNISQWEESNYSTSVEIKLVLMKMLMIEVYSCYELTGTEWSRDSSLVSIPQHNYLPVARTS